MFNRIRYWTTLSSGCRQLQVHIPEEQYPGGLTCRNIPDVSLSGYLGKSFHHPLLLRTLTKILLFCRLVACQDQSFMYQRKVLSIFFMVIPLLPVILEFAKLQRNEDHCFFSFTLNVVKTTNFSEVREKAKLINRNGFKFDILKECLN